MGPPLFVIVSGTHFHGVRRSARGIADALSEHARVLFVDPPTSAATKTPDLVTDRPTRRGRLVRESTGVFRLAPRVPPGKDRVGVRRLTTRMVANQIRSATAELEADRLVLFQQLAYHSVLGRIGEQVAMYHASDDLAAGAKLLGLDAKALSRAEEKAAQAADVVLAVSPALVERWANRGILVEFFPNGVNCAAFAGADTSNPATDVDLPHPIAGVVGTLSERLDMDLLHAVADRMSLLLIGPESFRSDRSGFADLIARGSVQWVGPKPFAVLGSYYRHIDVALVPYTLSSFNQSSFPLKSIEYLAAGKPVISTCLRTIEDLRAPGITIASGPAEFSDEAIKQAQTGTTDDSVARFKEFAGRHDWAVNANRLMEIAEERRYAV